MSRASIFIIATLLVPPWAFLFVGCYWYFLDNDPPMVINYQHPYFVSEPVTTREAAERAQITEVTGGSTVWIYREFCVFRSIHGVFRSRWQSDAFVWPVDDRAFVASPRGCHALSFAVQVPTSNPSRNVRYYGVREYEINPLRTLAVPQDPIPLRILANK